MIKNFMIVEGEAARRHDSASAKSPSEASFVLEEKKKSKLT